ncbi:hypothetical protein F5Y16DRAFT_379232 [Xylariaceae sp. FL0255]|nr:hypothetical protein F5Y16DRAFT_379232 [Xylariaceae sp. FL0255]
MQFLLQTFYLQCVLLVGHFHSHVLPNSATMAPAPTSILYPNRYQAGSQPVQQPLGGYAGSQQPLSQPTGFFSENLGQGTPRIQPYGHDDNQQFQPRSTWPPLGHHGQQQSQSQPGQYNGFAAFWHGNNTEILDRPPSRAPIPRSRLFVGARPRSRPRMQAPKQVVSAGYMSRAPTPQEFFPSQQFQRPPDAGPIMSLREQFNSPNGFRGNDGVPSPSTQSSSNQPFRFKNETGTIIGRSVTPSGRPQSQPLSSGGNPDPQAPSGESSIARSQPRLLNDKKFVTKVYPKASDLGTIEKKTGDRKKSNKMIENQSAKISESRVRKRLAGVPSMLSEASKRPRKSVDVLASQYLVGTQDVSSTAPTAKTDIAQAVPTVHAEAVRRNSSLRKAAATKNDNAKQTTTRSLSKKSTSKASKDRKPKDPIDSSISGQKNVSTYQQTPEAHDLLSPVKSSTGISSQNPDTSAPKVVNSALAVPKQTYIRPPRPWDSLLKLQPSAQLEHSQKNEKPLRRLLSQSSTIYPPSIELLTEYEVEVTDEDKGDEEEEKKKDNEKDDESTQEVKDRPDPLADVDEEFAAEHSVDDIIRRRMTRGGPNMLAVMQAEILLHFCSKNELMMECALQMTRGNRSTT